MAYDPAPLSVIDLKTKVQTGTDITSALQNAVTQIVSAGGISIPYGSYLLTGQIATGNKKVTFYLNGATITANSSFAGSMFYSDSSGGKLTIYGGGAVLDGNKATYTITGYGVNVGTSSAGCELYDLTIQNCPTDGASLQGTGSTVVQNCNSNSNGDVGWRGFVAGYIKFINSGASNNADSGGAFAASLGTEVFGGNWISNGFAGLAIYWGQNGASISVRARVVGANCSGNDEGLSIGQGIVYATVSGCVCADNNNIGINVDTILDDGTTAKNAFCAVTGNTVQGSLLPIRWNGAIGGSIIGNTVVDPEDINNGGIYVLGNSSKVLVDGNAMIGQYAYIQVQSGSSVTVGTTNEFYGLSATLRPWQGEGVLSQSGTYWLEPGATVYGDTLPATLIAVNTASASDTRTLPAVASVGNNQRVTFFKKSASNTLTIQPDGTEVFYNSDGTTAASDAYTNLGPTDTYISISDGTNVGWFRIASV